MEVAQGLIPSGRTKIPNGAAKVLRIEKEGGHRHWLDLRAFGDNQHNIGEKLAPRFHSCHVDESPSFHQGSQNCSLRPVTRPRPTEVLKEATENHNGGMKELCDS